MRERYRAIIIKDNKLLLMHRFREGLEFYVFPGGGLEAGETPKECCERELLEEFGIVIEAQKLIYLINQNGAKQGFFVAKWISGEIHTTDAEEYTKGDHFGTYDPTSVNLEEIPKLNILPPEVKQQLLEDLKNYNNLLLRPLVEFKCKDFKEWK